MMLGHNRPENIAALKKAYEVSGWKGYWQKALTIDKKRVKDNYSDPAHFASLYARTGESDQAFAWLERAYEERDQWLTYLKVEPAWDGLRSDPRFTNLLRRVGFSQETR